MDCHLLFLCRYCLLSLLYFCGITKQQSRVTFLIYDVLYMDPSILKNRKEIKKKNTTLELEDMSGQIADDLRIRSLWFSQEPENDQYTGQTYADPQHEQEWDCLFDIELKKQKWINFFFFVNKSDWPSRNHKNAAIVITRKNLTKHNIPKCNIMCYRTATHTHNVTSAHTIPVVLFDAFLCPLYLRIEILKTQQKKKKKKI
ncbi:hypothetical protein RFI_12633 [Reticulomyxa filosa]|uniref:Uncharacterized protein n=1 Tax=Reticulomyxa filosa TaxID=46433 RepID=X6NGN5_RETFI|nr:hypothetical protein RFI_12633 [Reticulomyxa filosa]|eukprot:ETO24522.1 hypothetical protein RFI_12633 [Reticulomyxa filosa]